jgi:hypothetical protein
MILNIVLKLFWWFELKNVFNLLVRAPPSNLFVVALYFFPLLFPGARLIKKYKIMNKLVRYNIIKKSIPLL